MNIYTVRGFAAGRVQGVGFRYFVSRHAEAEGLAGYARNLADGRVEFLLQGDAAAVARVVGQIRQGPRYARVDEVVTEDPVELPAQDRFMTA